MKKVADIRLFFSNEQNTKPDYLRNNGSCLFAKRTAMKLREYGFSFGDFDHLYLNFTTCLVENGMAPSTRPSEPWFRFFDVQLDETTQEAVFTEKDATMISQLVLHVLTAFFVSNAEDKTLISKAVQEAKNGEQMLMRFKEKKSVKYTAVVYLRLYNDFKFHPLLEVRDGSGKTVLRKDLKSCTELGMFGEICVNNERVMIKPRKSMAYYRIPPMTFKLPC